MRVGTSPLPGRSLSFIIGQLSPLCDPSVIDEVNAVSSILLQDGVRDLAKGGATWAAGSGFSTSGLSLGRIWRGRYIGSCGVDHERWIPREDSRLVLVLRISKTARRSRHRIGSLPVRLTYIL